jgi:hypothetical protein
MNQDIIPLHLVAFLCHVGGERRLARSRDARQDDVSVDDIPGQRTIVLPDGELHRLNALEVLLREGRLPPGRSPRDPRGRHPQVRLQCRSNRSKDIDVWHMQHLQKFKIQKIPPSQ